MQITYVHMMSMKDYYSILHLDATIFTKPTMDNREHNVHRGSKMLCKFRQRWKTLGKAAKNSQLAIFNISTYSIKTIYT